MSTAYHPPLALRWNRLACAALYYAKMPPTIAARALAMVHTAMYDAWTAYRTGKEVSTTTGARLKRPELEHTQQNREIAFSMAAYRVMEELFGTNLPDDLRQQISDLMKDTGCDTSEQTLDVTQPQGIGNLAAKLIVEYRRGDGAASTASYADYTGYKPVNIAPPKKPLADVGKWQPQLDDKRKPQKFLTPHWGLVRPFALEWGGQFRPPAPAALNSAKFKCQMEEIIRISACLTDEQKLIAEYWAGMHEDKFEQATYAPGYGYWTVPPAQCCRIANYIAVKNRFNDTNVIGMFFALTNALLDASIACWDAKEYYDYARPDSAIRELYDEIHFSAWGGPCRGAVTMEGEGWWPFLLFTPPFAEYPSGHSTFSRATAEIITSFCCNNAYGESITFPAKSSVIEPECTPAKDVTLSWPTLQDAANQAGWSRRYGGIHFEEGDLQGRELGRKVAGSVWRKARLYFNGTLG